VLAGQADLTGLGPDEQAVLRKALSPDPQKRFPSCQAFVKALNDIHRPAPKPKPPVSRLLTALLATGLAMALAVIVFLAIDPFRPKPPPLPKPDWLPPGWAPAPDSELVKDVKGKFYWSSLTRKVGDQEVVLMLIDKKTSDDPD